jgi:hypothetical protein
MGDGLAARHAQTKTKQHQPQTKNKKSRTSAFSKFRELAKLFAWREILIL